MSLSRRTTLVRLISCPQHHDCILTKERHTYAAVVGRSGQTALLTEKLLTMCQLLTHVQMQLANVCTWTCTFPVCV